MYPVPDKLYGELFSAVQQSGIFSDSKTFADAYPKKDPSEILNSYNNKKSDSEFSLCSFVHENFDFPVVSEKERSIKPAADIRRQIDRLWTVLQRDKDDRKDSSLIALPHSYVVPGGRFREIYYWDSYFTMLGLAESGKVDSVEDMVKNFAYLLDQVGMIPNGNRSYYCSRSQPPFFSLMVKLLAEMKQQTDVYIEYLPQLQIEYDFWMSGAEELHKNGDACRRVVRVFDSILNRHWDDSPIPRQESYREDIEQAEKFERGDIEFYRDIRAACETGWDFSSRWFADLKNAGSICTSNIIPIDLNSLLYNLEMTLSKAYGLKGAVSLQAAYSVRADKRKQAIQTYFFDTQEKQFVDVRLSDSTPSKMTSSATAFPLFLKLATEGQAKDVAEVLERDYLKAGGWVTTPRHSPHQWDAPNGWAPLQWVIYQGLKNYGYQVQAETGAQCWIDNNLEVYRKTGNLLEKYNVEEVGIVAGGGEYEVQCGFGWTNGVLLKLMNELEYKSE